MVILVSSVSKGVIFKALLTILQRLLAKSEKIVYKRIYQMVDKPLLKANGNLVCLVL